MEESEQVKVKRKKNQKKNYGVGVLEQMVDQLGNDMLLNLMNHF